MRLVRLLLKENRRLTSNNERLRKDRDQAVLDKLRWRERYRDIALHHFKQLALHQSSEQSQVSPSNHRK